MKSPGLPISAGLCIPMDEIQFSAVRAQGSGGQHVNKVSSAVHLRFDVKNSSLPEQYKQKILAIQDQRLNKEGVIVIKSQAFRSQEQNREAALHRLQALLRFALKSQKHRIATKPGRRAKARRMDSKTRHGQTKVLRRKPQI